MIIKEIRKFANEKGKLLKIKKAMNKFMTFN